MGRSGLKILAVYPGTFDPIHFGHEDIIRRGASLFDELLIAVYDKPLKSLLFSPAEVEFRNLKTGKCHRFGRVEPGLVRKSFGLE
jgi:cytidyltransferase-like protein